MVHGLSHPCSWWVSVELNTLIFKFFWSGKRDLVAHCVLVQPSCLGGFSVVDLSARLWLFIFQQIRADVPVLRKTWLSCLCGQSGPYRAQQFDRQSSLQTSQKDKNDRIPFTSLSILIITQSKTSFLVILNYSKMILRLVESFRNFHLLHSNATKT